MPLVAIPIAWVIAEAIVGALVIAGGAYVLTKVVEEISEYVARELADAIDKAQRDCKDCGCQECTPPRGTVGYRVDWVPPSRAHWPCEHSHVHFKIMKQDPKCICRWDKPKGKDVLCLPENLKPEDFNPSELGKNVLPI